MMTANVTEVTPQEHNRYDKLMHLLREASLLGGTADLLSWDREVMMPEGGLTYRSKQLAQLARLQHETFTSRQLN